MKIFMGVSSDLQNTVGRVVAAFLGLVMVFDVSGDAAHSGALSPEMHEQQISEWRQSRHDRLASEDGWLTLVGLEWLTEGENRLGSGPGSSIRVPGGPENWGTIYLEGDLLRFVPAKGSGVEVDGEPGAETLLIADSQGDPSVVSSGDLSFYVIFRESYALRIKDRKAETLLEFEGMDHFDFKPDWRFEARFIPAQEGQTIEIANVLGQVEASSVYGYAEFEREGKTYRLLGLGDEHSESVWFLFADRTSGRETYGAGRYLYSDGLPVDGRLVIDFNKAYNPPCVFSEYATCPLTPQENRLNLAVTAGEKSYHAHQ
jgi:uncharacterized protein (DUF1684 family)